MDIFSHIHRFFAAVQDAADGPPPFNPNDPEQLNDFVQYYTTLAMDNVISFIPKILLSLLILWIGLSIASKVYNGLLGHADKSPRIDTTLGKFMAAMAKYAIIAGTLLGAIAVIGIPVAKIFVILSAATLAIGLALQGSLSNVAAGLILIILRPYRIGDYVEVVGEEGTVEDINIFNTTLRTLDNVKIILANGEVRTNTIKNYSALGVRRLDIDFGIDYDDDMDKAMDIIKDTAAKDERVLGEPAPAWTRVTYLNDSSVDIQLRVYVKPETYWETQYDLIKAVKEAFDAGGINIPYPHVVEIEKS